jgi:hypothetical protein
MSESTGSSGLGAPDQHSRAERIAALIDGRISGEEGSTLLSQLAESEDDLSVMADAAAAADDLAVSGELANRASSTAIPISSAKNRRPAPLIFVGGLAAAAVATILLLRTSDTPGSYDAAHAMVATLSDKSTLPADWNYTPWTATRGSDAIPDTTAYIRIGARTTDLEFAIQSGSSQSQQFARDIQELLANVPGGGATATVFRSLAENPGSTELLNRAREGLAALPQQGLLGLGSWFEAARIAASRKDEKWFANNENQSLLRSLSDSKKISPASRAVAREILIHQYDWAAITRAFEQLLK